MYETIKDFFDSGNLFILFLTLAFFFVVEIIFFIEVATNETAMLIEKQAKLTADFGATTASKQDLVAAQLLLQKQINDNDLVRRAEEEKKKRNDFNYELARKTFFVPVSASVGLALIFFVVALVKRNLHLPDYVAVALVVFSFTTELLLYFIVMKNIDYVDDITMLFRVNSILPEELDPLKNFPGISFPPIKV